MPRLVPAERGTEGQIAVRHIRNEKLTRLRDGLAETFAFYRGHGFTECGSSPGYYEDVEDAVRMVKRLGPAP